MARTSRKQGKAEKQTEIFTMKTALYVRLSNEDNGGKSTDSIGNQLELLMDFIKRLENEEIPSCDISKSRNKKIEIIEIYMDNGQTGTDFDRPGWERMMKDVKMGRINCIIVKDLSRFARNYLEAGDYLEKIFPFLGIRFIAVNDHYDSAGEIFQEKNWLQNLKTWQMITTQKIYLKGYVGVPDKKRTRTVHRRQSTLWVSFREQSFCDR